MASYISPTISNYNDDAPPDDGTEVAENEVKWSTIKEELADPIKAYAEAIDSATTSAFASTGTATFCNNSNGNPNISDTGFTITTEITKTTWEAVGPTGAASVDYEWTAMDGIPATADWIDVRLYMNLTDTATSVTGDLYAREFGGTQGVSAFTNMIWTRDLSDGTSNAKNDTSFITARIPIDASNRFELFWTEGALGIADYRAGVLVGYGSNP